MQVKKIKNAVLQLLRLQNVKCAFTCGLDIALQKYS